MRPGPGLLCWREDNYLSSLACTFWLRLICARKDGAVISSARRPGDLCWLKSMPLGLRKGVASFLPGALSGFSVLT